MQSENNEERWALVTGASSGIGTEIALALAVNRWNIVAHGRNNERLQVLCDEIRRIGMDCHGLTAELSDPAEVRQLAARVKESVPKLTLLVNNAGWGSAYPLEQTDDAVWQQTIGSCLTGTFHCCRELLPLLKVSAPALIINNASIAARRGFPGFAAYSAAKGGVDAFSRALREELRPFKIGVTTLLVGATASPFWDQVEGEWDVSRMMRSETIGKFVAGIAELDPAAVMEECVIMPSGGAL